METFYETLFTDHYYDYILDGATARTIDYIYAPWSQSLINI